MLPDVVQYVSVSANVNSATWWLIFSANAQSLSELKEVRQLGKLGGATSELKELRILLRT